MWSAIFGGFVAGMLIAVMIGPVFFALIQTSMKRGFPTAASFALGIVLSDSLYFFLAHLGIRNLSGGSSTTSLDNWLGLGGGLFLAIFGIILLRRKPDVKEEDIEVASYTSYFSAIGKGFIINSLNPSALFYWASVTSYLRKDFGPEQYIFYSFFTACMLTVFGTDLLKGFLALRLKSLLTYKFLLWLNRISGIILIIFGARLIWTVVKTRINF